jgi:hypothetical protein
LRRRTAQQSGAAAASPSGFTSTDFIVQTLTAYGIPHDVVRFDQDATPRLDLQALFWNPDGTGRYSSFVM